MYCHYSLKKKFASIHDAHVCCQSFILIKLALPAQGHPRDTIIYHFVVSEMRYMIFYGPKNPVNHNKLIF